MQFMAVQMHVKINVQSTFRRLNFSIFDHHESLVPSCHIPQLVSRRCWPHGWRWTNRNGYTLQQGNEKISDTDLPKEIASHKWSIPFRHQGRVNPAPRRGCLTQDWMISYIPPGQQCTREGMLMSDRIRLVHISVLLSVLVRDAEFQSSLVLFSGDTIT